jgi:hypothetical protein
MRRNMGFSLVGSVIIGLALAGIGEAAGVPRAFVSINGSDANPCSAVSPCRSFNQALTVVEPGGEIIVQNSGGYSTGFTITQSVTIDAAGFNASVISTSNTDLCTISAGATDRVVLRGISFHGANIGNDAINVNQVGSLYLEHCSIAEFTDNGVAMLFGGSLIVTDTDVRACSVTGLDMETQSSTVATLVAQDSRCTECGNGVLLATFGGGKAYGMLTNCTASLCGNVGFLVESDSSGNAALTLSSCRAFRNFTGVFARNFSTGGASIVIANCTVVENAVGVNTSGVPGSAGVFGTSPGTNLIVGNNSGQFTTGLGLQ